MGPHHQPRSSRDARLRRLGRQAWALLGVLAVLALAGYVLSLLSFLVIPVILALFPATLLVPVAGWLKRHSVPEALASLLTILGGILLLGVVVGAMVPLVVAELPRVAESAGEGLAELEGLVERVIPGWEVPGILELMELIREEIGEVGDVAAGALGAAVQAVETVAGILLMLVVLFFILKDGRGLFDGILRAAPGRFRPRATGAAERAWDTLGSYFRGQLLVALIDAIFIGLGLFLLGVPMALPLALLIFFGGLFPIVGAVATGTLAVLVALADGGLATGLVVLLLVLAVQQLEGNVLEPWILSHAIALHPLVILLSITAGALVLGLLGAFLAVPAVAIARQALEYLVHEAPAEEKARAGAGEEAPEEEAHAG